METPKDFRTALAHYQGGRFADAASVCEQLVSQNSNDADALQLLGVLHGQAGRFGRAIELISAAIRIKPDVAEFHSNLGFMLRGARRIEDAIAEFQTALRLSPNLAELHSNLGVLLVDTGRVDEAIVSFRLAVQNNPLYAEAWTKLGSALETQGKFADALAAYAQAVRIKPDYATAQTGLANSLYQTGRVDEAIAAFGRSLKINPNNPIALGNLASALEDQQRFDEAIASFRRAIQIAPNYADGHHNLANVLGKRDLVDEAIQSCRRAISLRPDRAESHSALSILLVKKGEFEQAIAAGWQAIQLQPNSAEMHWGQAFHLLLLGQFEQGWKEFEWRLARTVNPVKRDFPQPQWHGEDPTGKTILLFTEGGFGDALHFVRYAPMVAQRGARVILECQPAMVRLLRSVEGISEIVPRGHALPNFDWQVPLPSLPMIFNTTLQTIPAAVPYLSPPAELVAQWAQKLSGDTAFKIGLHWAGSAIKNDSRSRTVAELAPLAELNGVSFYSLQKGPEADQPAPPAMHLKRLADPHADFADSAALVCNLDLVITVDSSAAHLAGALGKPVWVLIPKDPEFRWMLGRSDSPWYPTMRLFRQKKIGNWTDVIREMAGELRKLVIDA